MEFTVDDLPAIQRVLNRSENEDLSTLVQIERAALKVGLKYPVQDANQLRAFLQEFGPTYTVAWFQVRFAWSLPIKSYDDFIEKAKVAIQQLHIGGDKVHR